MKKLLIYVEIQTKITSLLTFSLVMLVLNYHNVDINVLNTAVFFAGMFLFDLTTTTINNYIDSKTNHEDFGFPRSTLKIIMLTLLALSILFGLWLVVLTDWVVLLLGMFSFFVGIIYTFGPIAISRQPYGEIVSGIFYGYVMTFILVYINLQSAFLSVTLGSSISIILNSKLMIGFLILGFIPTLLTSAIMLGNNTCDVEKDVLVNRFTLPFYIGKENAVKLLISLYALVFVGAIVGVLTGVYPVYALVLLLLAPKVLKNAKDLGIEYSKERSFPFVIQNFIMVMAVLILVMIIANII
ncbi:MAG: prenyltransferase [Erysipelothrix sp.]|nr:prenyltransferase [Erysipelothrix sp.]